MGRRGGSECAKQGVRNQAQAAEKTKTNKDNARRKAKAHPRALRGATWGGAGGPFARCDNGLLSMRHAPGADLRPRSTVGAAIGALGCRCPDQLRPNIVKSGGWGPPVARFGRPRGYVRSSDVTRRRSLITPRQIEDRGRRQRVVALFLFLVRRPQERGEGASLLWGSTIESAEPVDVFCGLDWMVDRLIEGVVRSIQAPRHRLRHAHTRSKENSKGGKVRWAGLRVRPRLPCFCVSASMPPRPRCVYAVRSCCV